MKYFIFIFTTAFAATGCTIEHNVLTPGQPGGHAVPFNPSLAKKQMEEEKETAAPAAVWKYGYLNDIGIHNDNNWIDMQQHINLRFQSEETNRKKEGGQ